MANRARGESELVINGTPHRLILTLGALAEIEDDIGMPIGQLEQVVKEGRVKPVATIIYWMLRAGGWKELKKEDMLELDFDMKDAIKAFTASMKSFSDTSETAGAEGSSGN